MQAYLDLIAALLSDGERRADRTGTGCLGLFGRQLDFDLQAGFPLLTTKALHIPSMVHELLWFLRGEPHTEYLQQNGVRIWDPWTGADGHLGPIYGVQWRSWPGPQGTTIDQLQGVVDEIKRQPHSRRLLVSAWNVGQLADMALPPCHVLFQFHVSTQGALSCHLYQRSADVFLGLPFNMASYALLTHLVAAVCGLRVGRFIHSLGDVHLYLNHLPQARQQLLRQPRALPQLRPLPRHAHIDAYRFEDIMVEDYEPHPHIKADVSV